MLVRIWCAVVLACMVGSLPAHAGDGAPTKAQLARAKRAFADGKRLHDAGKLAEAVEKFKLSYELSKNPLLLYNIGLTMEELGSDDLAAVYYRKFLAEAPADAAQRKDAADRVAAIARKLAPPEPPAIAAGEIPDARLPPEPPPAPSSPPAPPAAPVAPTAAPSPETAPEAGFQHRPIGAAPPGQPLDVTAVISEGSGLAVTLFFRASGQATFTSTPMLWRGKELVGRIPGARMAGSALQYYLEARAPSGALVARSGKSTSPHVINLDAAAPRQSYPDVAEPVLTQVVVGRDAEDPLARPGAVSGDGFTDVGSPRFLATKWTTTALAGVSLGAGIALYVLARDHARALEDDATGCGVPPCQKFDDFDRGIERTGQREQAVSNVALVGGAAVAAIAAYFWFRELTAGAPAPADRTSASSRAGRAGRRPAAAWQVVPQLGGDRGTGMAAEVRF